MIRSPATRTCTLRLHSHPLSLTGFSTLSHTPRPALVLMPGLPAGSYHANCYLVAQEVGVERFFNDPAQDGVPDLGEVLREHRLRPVAVLLTPGHIDHVWSVAPVCGAPGVPAWIHPDD